MVIKSWTSSASRARRLLQANSFLVVLFACMAVALCEEPSANPADAQMRPGDTVKVAVGQAPVKVGAKILTCLEVGLELEALEVRDSWVKVAVEKDGQRITGWVSKRHLKLSAAAPEKAPAPQPRKSQEKPAATEFGLWDGFRGIAWGTNLKDIEGMKLLESSDMLNIRFKYVDFKGYEREGEKLAIGGARLQRISYGFFRDRLCYVRIESCEFEPLLRALTATYGPSPSSGKERVWLWDSPDSSGVPKVSIVLFLRGCEVIYEYRPLFKEASRLEREGLMKAKEKRERDEEEAAKNARKDL